MAAALGLWNHSAVAKQTPIDAATVKADATNGSNGGDTSSDSATISANDFLTLLVTEMQNQDPTASTDPNEYIDQLVQVNSLEQLISINQNLSTALGSSTSSSSAASRAELTGSNSTNTAGLPTGSGAAAQPQGGAKPVATVGTPVGQAAMPTEVQGNLSIPDANAAAQRVAQSLSGRTHPR